MNRGVSTVLDVAVCLVLVSAAAVTLATATGGPSLSEPQAVDREAATAETLATTTATVRYGIGDGTTVNATAAGAAVRPASDERTRHGTLAALLADAAVTELRVEGRRVQAETRYTAAVREAVRPLLDGRTQIAAVWEPYPDAALRGRVVVGPAPPPDATVHVATLSVTSGMPRARPAARTAAAEGYPAVADVVAERVVDGLFPYRRVEVAVDGAAADDHRVRNRFENLSAATDANASLDDGVDVATDELTASLSPRIERDLRARYDDPRRAAAAVRPGRVTVVVRRWS